MSDTVFYIIRSSGRTTSLTFPESRVSDVIKIQITLKCLQFALVEHITHIIS
jgi:hypothetical protein